jgi:hypothetical protein
VLDSSDLIKAALESRVDILARWLEFWTALVVLGLLMEYGAAAADWKPKNIKSPRSFLWVRVWTFVGGALIVGGVAGELYVEFLASRAENSLRMFSDAANVAVEKEDADAGERAGIANKVAGEANKRAGQLEVKAEQLRKDNLELEASLSPRLFNNQDVAGERLSKFAPVNALSNTYQK